MLAAEAAPRGAQAQPQSPPVGPLPLRTLDACSEPIGSRVCPARASPIRRIAQGAYCALT
jgi:hypothetical protein